MNMQTSIAPRTLANVLLEIATVGPKVWHFPFPGNEEEESAALDRLDELQAEAREIIQRATGCTWDQISEACL